MSGTHRYSRDGASTRHDGRSRLSLVLLAVAIPTCVVLIGLDERVGAATALLALVLSLRPSLKSFAVLLVVASVFAPSIGDATSLDALTYVDEGASVVLGVLIPIMLKLSGSRLVRLPGVWFIAGTLVLGLVSSVVAGVSTSATLQGAFLLLKMPLLAFGLAQLKWFESDVRALARGVVHLLIPIVALSVLLNMVLGKRWVFLMTDGAGGYIDYRYDLLSSQGIFSHPLILGNVSAILALAAFATMMHFPEIKHARAALFAVGLAGIASFRRTAIVGLVAAVFFAWPKKARRTLLIGLCLIVPLLVVVLAADIQTTVTSTLNEYVYTSAPAPRTRLLIGSFDVAAVHAPLGAGFSRYGSFLAGVEYSPEYVRLGFPRVWGLSDRPGMSAAFLTDTQWPVLIGETGWIGFFMFIGFLFAIFRVFTRAARFVDEPHMQWVATFGRGAFVVAIVASIGLPVFTSTPVAPLLFGLCGVAVRLVADHERGAGADLERNKPATEQPVPK
jgi:hypothetical protein